MTAFGTQLVPDPAYHNTVTNLPPGAACGSGGGAVYKPGVARTPLSSPPNVSLTPACVDTSASLRKFAELTAPNLFSHCFYDLTGRFAVLTTVLTTK